MGVYNEEDVKRAKYNIAHYDWAKRIADGIISDANHWAAMDDEDIYNLIPPENPRALVVNYYHGCPIHGGDRLAFETSMDEPWRWRCIEGGEWWYPGAVVKNPKTGEDVIVEDDGSGFVPPDGFLQREKPYYFVAAYRFYRLGALIGSPYARTIPGKKAPSCLPVLSFAYVLTGEQKYAHKAFILLSRLADLYRRYDGLADVTKAHIGEISTTEMHYITNSANAFDLVFDGAEGDKTLLDFLASKGDIDYDKDGRITTKDVLLHIQNDLIMAMSEFARRMVLTQTSDWQINYVSNCIEIAQCLGDGEMMYEALEGERGLIEELSNAFYRDGKHHYCSVGYSVGNTASMARMAEVAHGFSDPKFYPEPLDLYHDGRFLMRGLWAFLRDIQCDGSVLCMGDGGLDRGKAPGYIYRLEDEMALVRMPEFRDIYCQRLTSACEGDVNAKRSDPWVLFHAEDVEVGKAEPLWSTMTESLPQSMLLPASQIAVLRHGRNIGETTHVGLHFCRGTAGHAHRDQLALTMIANGWCLTPDVCYWREEHPKHTGAWLRNAASHCLVVPDGRNQELGTGILHAYHSTPYLSVVEASAEGVYPGLSRYRRTVMLVPIDDRDAYVLDIFRVAGGEREHDYLFHSDGGTEGKNFELKFEHQDAQLKTLNGTLAGEEIAYASQGSGYSFIKDVQFADYDGQLRATWHVVEEDGKKSDVGIRLIMCAMRGREVLTGLGEGYGVFGRSPLDRRIIVRMPVQKGDATTFVALIEPLNGEARVESVELMEITPADANAQPVAVRVCLKDRTDYLLSGLEAEKHFQADLEGVIINFAGRFARVSDIHASGGNTAALLEYHHLSMSGIQLTCPATVSGVVESIALNDHAILVTSPLELPCGDVLRGYLLRVLHADAPRAVPSGYIVDKVERIAAQKYRIFLSNPPSFVLSIVHIEQLNAEAGTLNARLGVLPSQAKRFLDGKHIAKEGVDPHQSVRITAQEGSLLRLSEKAATAQFEVGKRAVVYDVGAGDRWEIATHVFFEEGSVRSDLEKYLS